MKKKECNKRRYVGIGDLVADCYYENGNLVKVDGGGSRFNVICNLAARGNDTFVISNCGSDLLAKICIESLESQGVNTKLVEKRIYKTKTYHHLIQKNGTQRIAKVCPICGNSTWYSNPLTETYTSLSYLKDDDIIILDGLEYQNCHILLQAKQEKVIVIRSIKQLAILTNEEILSVLQSNLQIMQLTAKVEKYLLLRFQLKNNRELYSLLQPGLLVITRGVSGADFITKDLSESKTLYYCQDEVDNAGVGDIFFSFIIESYFDNDKMVNLHWIDDTFFFASQLTCKATSSLGARGHLWPGYTSSKYECICNH